MERPEPAPRTRRARITAKVRGELASRLSPERTRRATLIERWTVVRLSWGSVVRLNRYLEFFGRITTVFYVAFIATIVFGVDWKGVVTSTFNDGRPVRGAIILAVVLPTLIFVALHSLFGYGRWRLQRELWRRDVEQLSKTKAGETGA
jgi:hypothetical protein